MFKKYDWFEFYRYTKDNVPSNIPGKSGNYVTVSVFVDAKHGGNKLYCLSQTGILVFMNKSPIHWYSKKQPSVETSTFGGKFYAVKVGVDMVEYLRYKLKIFGVPLDGTESVVCDN